MNGKGYKDLIVWQKSMNLAELIYRITANFPKDKLYGLVSQMRRASVSVPSNIAEGSKRKYTDGVNFLRVSFGSGSEIETQLELSKRLGYIKEEDYFKVKDLLDEVMKILSKLISNKSSNI